jgi:hypothetical protein
MVTPNELGLDLQHLDAVNAALTAAPPALQPIPVALFETGHRGVQFVVMGAELVEQRIQGRHA